MILHLISVVLRTTTCTFRQHYEMKSSFGDKKRSSFSDSVRSSNNFGHLCIYFRCQFAKFNLCQVFSIILIPIFFSRMAVLLYNFNCTSSLLKIGQSSLSSFNSEGRVYFGLRGGERPLPSPKRLFSLECRSCHTSPISLCPCTCESTNDARMCDVMGRYVKISWLSWCRQNREK